MAMVCPKCQASYKQRLQCPKCAVRLEYQTGGRSFAADWPGERGGWQETPWGRIAVGLMLAQGMYYGLWHLGNAGLMVTDAELANTFWNTLQGLIVIQSLQALGLLVGGALAGAGRKRGMMFGALVGVWNGLIFLILQSNQKDTLTPVALYGQPLLQTAFGALGGAIGRFVWKPISPVSEAAPPLPKGARSPGSQVPKLFAGPVAWVRVVIGAAVAVAGALSAGMILDFVLDAGQGKLTVETHLQAYLITWEITALAAAAGSALAGANTRNGPKQGLCVGILASVALFGVSIGRDRLELMSMILTVFTALVLCLAGGWFGGSLFPPLKHLTTQKRRIPATV